MIRLDMNYKHPRNTHWNVSVENYWSSVGQHRPEIVLEIKFILVARPLPTSIIKGLTTCHFFTLSHVMNGVVENMCFLIL
jgi:hypothetical protein